MLALLQKEAIFLFKNNKRYKNLVVFTLVTSLAFGIVAYNLRVNGYMTVAAFFIIFAAIINMVSSIDFGGYLFDKWREGLIVCRDKPESSKKRTKWNIWGQSKNSLNEN